MVRLDLEVVAVQAGDGRVHSVGQLRQGMGVVEVRELHRVLRKVLAETRAQNQELMAALLGSISKLSDAVTRVAWDMIYAEGSAVAVLLAVAVTILWRLVTCSGRAG